MNALVLRSLMVKRCRRCGEVKPRFEFYRYRARRDGLQPYCKACNYVAMRAHRLAHPDRHRRSVKRWRARNPEVVRRWKRESYQRNRESILERQRQQRDADREAHNASRRRYYRGSGLARRFGLKPGDYEAMLARQGNRCAMCHRHQEESSKALAVDHCHATGEVRGLLCFSCNAALGHLENEEWRAAADAYLGRKTS